MDYTAEDHYQVSEHEEDAGAATFAPKSKQTIESWKKASYFDWTYGGLEGDISNHDFLHYVTTAVDEESNNSWFNDDQIDVALTLLIKESALHASVFLVPTLYGQVLCSIGSNRQSLEALADYPTALLEGLTNPEKRWIIAPCSDGMLTTHENLQERETARQAAQTGASGYLGEGTHWGLLVVDKWRSDARYIDGLLELRRRRRGGHKIKSMLPTGRVAGKILCAIEAILDSTPGDQFATSTLKYVPHQSENNSYSGDEGSGCGPYVYAMLEYTLKHGTQMLEDLLGTFSEGKRRQHVTGLNFNSWKTRRDIRDRVHHSKIELEADPLKSLGLDASIMHILGLISPDAVLEKLNSYNARLHSLQGVPRP